MIDIRDKNGVRIKHGDMVFMKYPKSKDAFGIEVSSGEGVFPVVEHFGEMCIEICVKKLNMNGVRIESIMHYRLENGDNAKKVEVVEFE